MKLNAFLVSSIGLLSKRSQAFSPNHILKNGRPATRIYSDYLSRLSSPVNHYSTTTPIASTSQEVGGGFQHVPKLGLEQADAIANNAVGCCRRNGFSPVTVVVLDASGSLIVSKRMDGCPPVVFPDFALAKATTGVVMGYPSRTFRDKYTADEASAKFCQMTTMVDISNGRMAPFPGGIVLKLGDYIIGAVGVSGASGDEDEYCAIRGVVESGLGLTTLPETHSCATVKDQFRR
mmetsp:Transcript_30489/g.34752  ORF Transcript_30489/g.34752 Transcript_30489/m.34752 type:complete len:234 (-) Transcript_30489:283-984(-)